MRLAELPNERENEPEIPAFRALISSQDSQFAGLEVEIAENLVRRYSRFAETIGGDRFDHDRPTAAVLQVKKSLRRVFESLSVR
jgi:hypothetical protein